MYKTLSLAAAALFAFAPAAMLTAAPEPIVVTKTVRTNPTLYFQGVPGDGELTRQMRSFLGACGWFDLSGDPKAEYVLSGRRESGRAVFTLTTGGAPAGSWGIPLTGNSRRMAQQMVDAIIQNTFKELKVKGFCSTKIAFCAETASGVKNIYACDIDGGNVEQITNYNALCVEPCWFPDGKAIGYSKYNRTGIDVIETRLNPKRSRVLTAFRGINTGAAISPDGRNLAVILSPDHKVDLYVMPIGGRTPRRLTNSIAVEASPCWSPDGREIAFVSDETGVPKINIISADGREPPRSEVGRLRRRDAGLVRRRQDRLCDPGRRGLHHRGLRPQNRREYPDHAGARRLGVSGLGGGQPAGCLQTFRRPPFGALRHRQLDRQDPAARVDPLQPLHAGLVACREPLT